MSRIKKTSPLLSLSNFQTFIVDNNPLSQYFKISELGDIFTAGKNGFLIEGSTFLKPSTEIKIEVLDTEGNPLFVQPGEGIPEYYEGLSKLIGVYVYEDTPIGIGKITILGELDTYIDENGFTQPIPEDWEGIYNIKWERDIKINKNIPNETRVRFVRRPDVIIEELNGQLRIDFTHTKRLKGQLEHYTGNTFIVKWDEKLLEADAYIEFQMNPDNRVSSATMRAVSTEVTDFSFDFRNLDLQAKK